jgi:hypothetical protein
MRNLLPRSTNAHNSDLKFHPLADIFPLLDGAELGELVADIKANGQNEPIILFDGMILDGRNQYRACQAVGIQAAFLPYHGKDPLGYVISANLRRRQLSETQRAMVAAKLATLPQGQRQSDQLAGVANPRRSGSPSECRRVPPLGRAIECWRA